jgi:predicted DCC family thiol-disulfide oxidoreductase YuxK
MSDTPPLPPRVVLYDGICGLCDKSVQWLLDHDPDGQLRFAPLQGPTAASILARHPSLPRTLETVIFVEQDGERERVHVRSHAIFHICKYVRGVARGLAIFRFLPAVLTDLAYRLVARLRYRIWGQLDQCRVPTPDERARFLT